MVGRNIRYYRQMKGMTQSALAQSVGIGKMAISNYEAGKRVPDYETSRQMASALGVSLSMLLAPGYDELAIVHGAFRKQSALTKGQQEFILGQTDRYLERLYEVVGVIGEAALPAAPVLHPLPADDLEAAGQKLRQILGLSAGGPVGNITDILENKGFIVCPISFSGRGFSGNSGTVCGRPYIAINTQMPAERQRFTLIHELAHLAFAFEENQNDERMVDGIAGAFLLPRADALRELGPKRNNIRNDLSRVQKEYGISMAAVVMRALQIGIISKGVFEATMKWMSALGIRTNEPSACASESSHLLEQLTSRAVAEEEIGISKAAELLEMPLSDVRRLCFGGA